MTLILYHSLKFLKEFNREILETEKNVLFPKSNIINQVISESSAVKLFLSSAVKLFLANI